MAVHCGVFFVPPAHLTALEDYMRGKPGDWKVIYSAPSVGKYTLQGDIDEKRAAIVNITLDIEPILDENAEFYNNANGQRWGDGRRVASVPLGLRFGENELRGLGEAQNAGDEKYVRKVLNDPDFRKFRTFPGKL